MGTVRRIDEQAVVDELLAQFTEELRTSGCTNFALLEQCPAGRRRDLRALMNVAALMHWAVAKQEQDKGAERERQETSAR